VLRDRDKVGLSAVRADGLDGVQDRGVGRSKEMLVAQFIPLVDQVAVAHESAKDALLGLRVVGHGVLFFHHGKRGPPSSSKITARISPTKAKRRT
jgi:hypothetical protein